MGLCDCTGVVEEMEHVYIYFNLAHAYGAYRDTHPFIGQAHGGAKDSYGCTETGCLASNGSAAKELRLRDVPELGYFTSDVPPRGEILARVEKTAGGEEKGFDGFVGSI